jgi:hypothetical protein
MLNLCFTLLVAQLKPVALDVFPGLIPPAGEREIQQREDDDRGTSDIHRRLDVLVPDQNIEKKERGSEEEEAISYLDVLLR